MIMNAFTALKDFESLLRVMNTDSLDADHFQSVLQSVGYRGDTHLIFRKLLLPGESSFSLATLKSLYASPSYTACTDHVASERDLMGYVKELFRKADPEERGFVNEEGLKNLLHTLLLPPTETTPLDESKALEREELDKLLRALLLMGGGDNEKDFAGTFEEKKKDDDGNFSSSLANDLVDEILSRCNAEGATLEQLSSILLRYNNIPTSLRVDGFDSSHLDPFQVSDDAFVQSVEEFVFQHAAVNHHLLDSLQKGVYGDATVAVVCNFLRAYRFFTRNFCEYLNGCLVKMSNEEHVHLLMENQEEENGNYEEDDINMMKDLGLDPELLKGVAHRDLFAQCIDNLDKVSPSEAPDTQVLEGIAQSMVDAFGAACLNNATSTAATSIAAMYFGSELLVSVLYRKISGFLQQDDRLSKQDLAFFILHIDMDVEHAQMMRKIVLDHCDTEQHRCDMVSAVAKIMDGRVDFFDKFVQVMFPPTGHGGVASGKLYNKQSNNWVRKKANCLSDFTGRPVVFDLCAPHVRDGFVLDVGSGEGYAGRKFIEMGAAAVTGIDISSEMVARAQENAISPNETYLVGNAARLQETIAANPATIGVLPGISTREGFYDLAVGIFVFNYTSIFEMNQICRQVHNALKPGGHFVFSVPHPFMLNAHDDAEDTFAFVKGDDNSKSAYFSLRDRKFSGTIKTLDGRVLNVKMCFKAISDYIDAVTAAGFSIDVVHEARVLPEHVAAHPHFFESVKDSPLHIVFKVRKAETQKPLARKITWRPYQYANASETMTMVMPPDVRKTLDSVVYRLMNQGYSAESYQMSSKDLAELEPVADFAQVIRQRVQVDTGVAIIQGMNVESEGVAKLSFLLLTSLVGRVDGSARGKLFDVRDAQLCTSEDNVLFSVSNREATWHTDGASIHRSYDVASLLCINPAHQGGEIRVSNAANAWDRLEKSLPPFLLFELCRNLPRDILENGGGKGRAEDVLLAASRSPALLQRRVRCNAYPIYRIDNDSGGLQFRYMRYWIETGHAKAGLPVSPLLEVALDLLDQALDDSQCRPPSSPPRALQAGEALLCHNGIMAHARGSFVNRPGAAPRHKVRAWIQL